MIHHSRYDRDCVGQKAFPALPGASLTVSKCVCLSVKSGGDSLVGIERGEFFICFFQRFSLESHYFDRSAQPLSPEFSIQTHYLKDFCNHKTYYWSHYKVKAKQATAPPSFITTPFPLDLWICNLSPLTHENVDTITTGFPPFAIQMGRQALGSGCWGQGWEVDSLPPPVIMTIITGTSVHFFFLVYALKRVLAWTEDFSTPLFHFPPHVFRQQKQSTACKAQTGQEVNFLHITLCGFHLQCSIHQPAEVNSSLLNTCDCKDTN